MAEKLIAVPESNLTDIADAIRLKRDIATSIPVDDMAMQIGLIESGGSDTNWFVNLDNEDEHIIDSFLSDGVERPYVGRNTSSWILLEKGTYWTSYYQTTSWNVVYDLEKNYIKSFSTLNIQNMPCSFFSVSKPCYVRFSQSKNRINNMIVFKISNTNYSNDYVKEIY